MIWVVASACELRPPRQFDRCDWECLSSGVVKLAGDKCHGLVVSREGSLAQVLTAAHCVTDVRGTPIDRSFVRPLGSQHGAPHQASRIRVHPRFKRLLNSPYDFAVLDVDAWPNTRAVPVESRRTPGLGTMPLSAILDHTDGEPTRVPMSIRTFNSLVLQLSGDGNQLCRGSSGAPVVVEREGGFSVVGIISHGSRSCDGRIEGGLAHVAYADLLSGHTSAQTCVQCQDELAVLDGPCSGPLERCTSDPDCRTVATCVDRCEDDQCLARCREEHAPLGFSDLGRVGAWMRCVCGQRCVSACPGLCDVEGR